MQSDRWRELELLLLTMFAAVPLYVTNVVSIPALVLFHAVMAAMALQVARGQSPQVIPTAVLRGIAAVYIVFYVIDAAFLSRSAIAASSHLVLFIALYQPVERKNNQSQRLLTTALIFIASIATATNIAVVPFVLAFAFLMFRQLMYVSHLETIRAIGREYNEPSSARAAAFYLMGTAIVGALLFPLLPRVRNPMVRGIAGALNNATTGISDSIDFNQQRNISQDASIVARVWMGPDAVPFFTPLRLRARLYDRFRENVWLQSRRDDFRSVSFRDGRFRVGRPVGFSRTATVQQRLIRNTRLFPPSGTWAISGVPALYEAGDTYALASAPREVVTYTVEMARDVTPMRFPEHLGEMSYPVTPRVGALARQIVGDATEPMQKAGRIERYLQSNFRYIPNPADIGRALNVDEFLLVERRGHCEYFAAGMVALLTAESVPSRIAGGFYGGRLNPLTGYFTVRAEDAHAWVEAWDGGKWVTFDPTPASLRPGNTQAGLMRVYASAIGDSINYFWDRYVLTFGLSDQVALAVEALSRARQLSTRIRESLAARRTNPLSGEEGIALAIAVVLILIVMVILRRRRPVFELLAEDLRRRGVRIEAATTMEEALSDLREQHPEVAGEIEPLIKLYDEERFSPTRDRGRVAVIRRRLSELRP